MAEYPISKTQARLCGLLNLQHDGTDNMAARLLEAAGMPPNGQPAGHTWRTCAKLSDADLLAALPTPLAVKLTVKTGHGVELERRAAYRERQESIRQHYNNMAREPRDSQEGFEYHLPFTHRAEHDADVIEG